eukprot:Protomagalhaensia_sp_Gyna_25__3549@NODE_3190_length_690_cov_19_451613_g2672_i0_p1_GENE_NODE_3190_length_690_cov_19_451613_g2672_i0NODE_3190_length_690_cov_19_451613_g2672_i0_p1_ORF_typecomplete_len188_score14_00_NODE_3190_length_690_cov_19_451613_g2672_i083646
MRYFKASLSEGDSSGHSTSSSLRARAVLSMIHLLARISVADPHDGDVNTREFRLEHSPGHAEDSADVEVWFQDMMSHDSVKTIFQQIPTREVRNCYVEYDGHTLTFHLPIELAHLGRSLVPVDLSGVPLSPVMEQEGFASNGEYVDHRLSLLTDAEETNPTCFSRFKALFRFRKPTHSYKLDHPIHY